MTTEDLTYFTWFRPRPKNRLVITVPNPGGLNCSRPLAEQLPGGVEIGVSPDGCTLCLRERAEGGYQLPKNGRLRDEELVACLTGAGVRLPARYAVTREEDCWIARLEPQARREWKEDARPAPRKPSARRLKSLEKEVGLL